MLIHSDQFTRTRRKAMAHTIRFLKTTSMLILTSIMLAGCVRYASNTDYAAAPDPSRGYVYGRLVMDNYFELTVVLELKNLKTGAVTNLKFESYTDRSRPREISLFPIEPGDYRIEKMFACPARRAIFTFASLDLTPKRAFECAGCEPFSRQFTVKKGAARYIGDFSGFSYGADEAGAGSVKWEIQRATDNFGESTRRLKELYPSFASLPAEPIQ